MRWHSAEGNPPEFDRPLLTPVSWPRSVLRAVFSCPCTPNVLCTPSVLWSRASDCGSSAPRSIKSDPSEVPPCNPHHLQHRSPGWLCSNGESREQAHLPAEQPSSGQDPRLPPAHAHPRRPGHPGCSSPQGSLRTVRLRLDACYRRVIVCEEATISPQFFGGRAEQADLVRAAA